MKIKRLPWEHPNWIIWIPESLSHGVRSMKSRSKKSTTKPREKSSDGRSTWLWTMMKSTIFSFNNSKSFLEITICNTTFPSNFLVLGGQFHCFVFEVSCITLQSRILFVQCPVICTHYYYFFWFYEVMSMLQLTKLRFSSIIRFFHTFKK